jgi:hypothetical protein
LGLLFVEDISADRLFPSYGRASQLIESFRRPELPLLEEVTGFSRNRRYRFKPYLDLFPATGFSSDPASVYSLRLSDSISEAQTFFPSAIGPSNAERLAGAELHEKLLSEVQKLDAGLAQALSEVPSTFKDDISPPTPCTPVLRSLRSPQARSRSCRFSLSGPASVLGFTSHSLACSPMHVAVSSSSFS